PPSAGVAPAVPASGCWRCGRLARRSRAAARCRRGAARARLRCPRTPSAAWRRRLLPDLKRRRNLDTNRSALARRATLTVGLFGLPAALAVALDPDHVVMMDELPSTLAELQVPLQGVVFNH